MNRELKCKTAREQYWRRRVEQENEMPNGEQVLIAKRRLVVGSKVYDVGSVLPTKQIALKNLEAMISARAAAYQPRNRRELPKPTPARKRPDKIEIVDDADVVLSWKKTLALTAERCGGDIATARDLLAADRAGIDLFLRASRVHQERERRRLKTFSLPEESIRL
jgi:hypothetical protein